MKILAVFIMLVGAAFGLGELAWVKYFAGEERAAGEVFSTKDGSASIDLQISQEDLPVRVNLRAFGWLERMRHTPIAFARLRNGLGGDKNEQEFHFALSEEYNQRDGQIGSGNVTLHPSSHYNVSNASRLFEEATPGDWSLSIIPLREEDYKFDTIEATVYAKSRAIDWRIAGTGLACMLFGMCWLIAMVKKENPDA